MAVPAREFGRDRGWVVARRLRRRRHELELKQTDVIDRLAEMAGLRLTPGAYSNFETRGTTDLAQIEALALALECRPAYLAGWSDDPKSDNLSRPLPDIVEEATRVYLARRSSGLSVIDGEGRGGRRTYRDVPLLS